MGTNFYYIEKVWRVENDQFLVPGYRSDAFETALRWALHVGKRSGAGFYCHTCKLTLCLNGERWVHYSAEDAQYPGDGCGAEVKWSDVCPKCGCSKDMDVLELIARDMLECPVRYTCSFSWAKPKAEVEAFCQRHLDEDCIEDEYGSRMTGTAFLAGIKQHHAIHLFDVVGQDFS